MKLIYIIVFLISIFFCKNIFAQKIAVVNIQLLIDNNNKYLNKLNELENSQNKFLKNFEIEEKELSKKLKYIEDSKLILNETEINLHIEKYNTDLNKFKLNVDEFNIHYQNQIIQIRENVLKEIIILLEKYAIENSIDLILDSTSYLIASNSIDITDIINKQLENINIKLEFKDFENN